MVEFFGFVILYFVIGLVLAISLQCYLKSTGFYDGRYDCDADVTFGALFFGLL